MVPNIRKNVGAAIDKNVDMSGRPLTEKEKAWLESGLGETERIESENKRTEYIVPTATFTDQMALYLGGREIRFMHLGNAHTAGDLIMWLPKEKIVATGDIVTAPVPLMPSPYTDEYVEVLGKIKALGFQTLVPGHGLVEHDVDYIDLLSDLIRTVSTQMKTLVAKGLSEDDATKQIDYSSVKSCARRRLSEAPFHRLRFRRCPSARRLHDRDGERPCGSLLVKKVKTDQWKRYLKDKYENVIAHHTIRTFCLLFTGKLRQLKPSEQVIVSRSAANAKLIDDYLTKLEKEKNFSGGLLIIKDGKTIFQKRLRKRG